MSSVQFLARLQHPEPPRCRLAHDERLRVCLESVKAVVGLSDRIKSAAQDVVFLGREDGYARQLSY